MTRCHSLGFSLESYNGEDLSAFISTAHCDVSRLEIAAGVIHHLLCELLLKIHICCVDGVPTGRNRFYLNEGNHLGDTAGYTDPIKSLSKWVSVDVVVFFKCRMHNMVCTFCLYFALIHRVGYLNKMCLRCKHEPLALK